MNDFFFKNILIFLLFQLFQKLKSNEINKIKKQNILRNSFRFCGVDQIKNNISKITFFTPEEMIKYKNRKLDSDKFEPIKIFLDTTYILSQGEENSYLKDMISIIIQAMEKCEITLEKLIKVIPYTRKFKMRLDQTKTYGINKINDELELKGVSADLIIFPKFARDSELTNSVLASAATKSLDSLTNRPNVGVVNINPNIDFSLGNSINYLESILLHEFTHILGFTYDLFYFFPGGLNNTVFRKKDKRIGLIRTYIKTPKLIETAKKYFKCDSIDGIELENQGGEGTSSSHWEARILLGDYMNGNIYTIEQVISEFTLALLEDSGWYKINYYTGGLMRYGKNKGCDFIEKDCLNEELETQFSNEFFSILDADVIKPRCSPGRQSRGYNLLFLVNSLENKEYNRFQNNFGYKSADYCPVCQEYPYSSNNLYYIGNCQIGNNNYGSKIHFGKILGYENDEIPKILGEKYSQNSFCSLTSIIPKNNNGNNMYKIYKSFHPSCYPMFCSERSLTIQINEQYIVCPREGGKISIGKNYEGFIYCPDYNLICTGTMICNDMFDCVEKNSLIKSNSYDYDYEMNNSQDIDDIEMSNILVGYELSDDGICPKNCIQCLENKKCFQCIDKFKLIGKKINDLEPIICSNSIDVSYGYYKVDNIYYECLKDCAICTSGIICDKCIKNKKLNNNRECIELIENCKIYDENEKCIKCINNYIFIGNDRTKCININNNPMFNINNYFTEDNGISYFPCNTFMQYCEECSKRDVCSKCIYSHIFLDDNKSICINKKELNESKKAYKIDEYNYKSCFKSIDNCVTCDSKNYCLSCEKEYGIINDIHSQCESLKGKEKKYYFEESNGVYYFCNKSLNNCEECSNKNKCILCKNGYNFDPYNNCVNTSLLSDFFIDKNNQTQKCSNFIENCKFCSSEDLCNYCNYNYSFLNYKKNECKYESELKEYNNYYTLDNGINYYSCDFEPNIKGIGNCSECRIENKKLNCIKCKENFGILDNNLFKCYDILNELYDKINNKSIYTTDNGTNYYSCEKSIENCSNCINNNICIKCVESNVFFNDNFSKCYSKIDFKIGYYPNEDETIYYPCLDNCGICNNSYICLKCILNYAFLKEDREKCINIYDTSIFDINKYYTENDGISYYPCDTIVKNCDECSLKDECNKCISSYAILDNIKSYCLNKEELDNNKSVYKIDEFNYKSCYLSINKCLTCNSYNYCLSCENGYGIINDMHSKCEILKGRENEFYFEENNGVYYSCNKSLKYCEKCLDKNTCISCLYSYILPYNETKCININENELLYFYEKKENIYKKCNYGIKNCFKCTSKNNCIQCEDSYTLLNNNTQNCEIKFLYENNPEYITFDGGINYYNCNNIIENCSNCKLNKDNNLTNCINCKNNFTLLDNNLLKCYNIDDLIDLINKNEIFTNDNGINYFSCNKKIDYCNKCENEKKCILCNFDYAFYEDDNLKCYSKNKFEIGFFSDEKKIRYYSCLLNCDICENKTICEKCSENYMPNEKHTECLEKLFDRDKLKEKCIIKIKRIQNEDFELIFNGDKSLNKYIYEYQKENENNNYALNFYTNDKYNFSMSLFKYSECSLFLFEKGNKKISTDNIIVNLGNSLNNDNLYIQSFIQFNNKISYSLYDSLTVQKVNIQKNCLDCKTYEITNNYSNTINNYIGKNILLLAQNEKIDLFNEKEKIFNDICQNLTINSIDFPLRQRKSRFYLGNKYYKNKILCDINCNLIKDNNENYTSICSCPINDNDLENLLKKKDGNNENLNDIENYVDDNQINIFKCIPDSFKLKKIKNNPGFILSICVIGLQILCYIYVTFFPLSKEFISFPFNPPPKNNQNKTENQKFDNSEENKIKNDLDYKLNNKNKYKENKENKENKDEINLRDIEIKITNSIDTDKKLQKKSLNKNEKIENDLYLDYINFNEAKIKDKRSFIYYYYHILFFNQLLLNLFSSSFNKVSNSFIPLPIKIIRLLFLYMINLFINAILTNNNYLLKKYNYFNDKYNIKNNIINISNKEKISYSIKYGKTQITSSFFICLILLYIFGYLFNTRKKIAHLLTNGRKDEISEKYENKDEKIKKIKSNMILKFKFFIIISFIIMIIIFFYLTNFCAVYYSTVIDIISQSIMSFILLQICPFIICLIVSILRYIGLKYNFPLL